MSPKDKCVRNWKDYNKALIQRGQINLWFHESLFKPAPPTGQRGRPLRYETALIEAGMVLKNVYHLTFRSLQGFLQSLLSYLKMDEKIANYSTFCRRQKGLSVGLSRLPKDSSIVDIVVDSTGLKIYGEGEWCVRQHGKSYQRSWRKVHLAIDSKELRIVSCALSSSRVQDGWLLGQLLDEIPLTIRRVIGDGAYDKYPCYEIVNKRKAKAVFPPQRGARLSRETPYRKKEACDEAIRQRDESIEQIREKGLREWKKETGYHKRNLVETTMYRLKSILGERLKAKTINNQLLEVQLKCYVLNKMMALNAL